MRAGSLDPRGEKRSSIIARTRARGEFSSTFRGS
jgi:hypothetical protein